MNSDQKRALAVIDGLVREVFGSPLVYCPGGADWQYDGGLEGVLVHVSGYRAIAGPALRVVAEAMDDPGVDYSGPASNWGDPSWVADFATELRRLAGK